MDDLVVIILTLIIAVAGVISQAKKKKQNTVPENGQKQPEDIWNLFRDEPIPAPQPKTEPQYDIVEDEESVPYENEQDYKFYSNKEGGKLINIEPEIQRPVEEAVTKKKEKFSLRKAVIYSEILNRKYI